jgi:outer membrane receptor for monomeric catechols
MQDAAMRRRIVALVKAALLAISEAALTSAYFTTDAQASYRVGHTLALCVNLGRDD